MQKIENDGWVAERFKEIIVIITILIFKTCQRGGSRKLLSSEQQYQESIRTDNNRIDQEVLSQEQFN